MDKINLLGKVQTRIYEVDHITRTMPFLKSQSQYMNSSQNGVTLFNCLNTDENFVTWNDEKNWKKDEQGKFFENITQGQEKAYTEKGFYHE